MHQPEHQRVNRLKRPRGTPSSPDSEEIKNIFDPNKSQKSSLKRSPLVLSIPGTSEQNETFQPIPNPDPTPVPSHVPSLDQRLGSRNPLPFLESSLQSTDKKKVNPEVEKNAGREASEKGGSYAKRFDGTAGHGRDSSQINRSYMLLPVPLNPNYSDESGAKKSVTPSEADYDADSDEEDPEVRKLTDAVRKMGNRSEEFEYRSPYPWWKIW